MRFHAVGFLAVVSMLCGALAALAQIVPLSAQAQSLARRALPLATRSANALEPVVYVAFSAANQINVYSQTHPGKLLTKITDQLNGPSGMWVDQARNLWVTNTGGYILMFPPGAAKATTRIEVPPTYGRPTQIWVAADGTIYSVNCADSCTVTHKKPGGTWFDISNSDIPIGTGIVGDGQGNLYEEGFSQVSNGGTVDILVAGKRKWQRIGFPFIAQPGEIAFDVLGRLAIADASVGNVFSYAVDAIQLQDAFRCYNCSFIAFDQKGDHLWAVTSATPSDLEEYAFPGGAPAFDLRFANLPIATGVAVSPSLYP